MIEIVPEDVPIDREYYASRLEEIARHLQLEGRVTVKLGSKDESRELNAAYLDRDYPTDVLSFPIQEALPDGYYVGDIFICYPLAQEQARENNHPLEEEMWTLMIHGLLHLAGYDHETDGGEMSALQEELLDKIARRSNL